jgi:2-methylcitrate dehydratase PrpD
VEDPNYTSAYPTTINCRFEVTLKSGNLITIHQTNPKGHPANPMHDNELEEKFTLNCKNVLARQQSRDLLDQLWHLEQLEKMETLFTLMQTEESSSV